MASQPSPSHPVASTSASDPATVSDLLPLARALASGDTEAADAALKVLPAERLSDPPARLVRALLAWRCDELAEAIAVLRPAHDAEPENGSYAEVLASLYALVGNLGESLFLGKLATGLGLDETLHGLVPADFPTFGRAFLGIEERPLVKAARDAANRDRPVQAIRLLRDHVELFPDDQEAWQELVRLLLSQGRAAEAEAASEGLRGHDDAATLSLLARARCAAGAHGLAAGGHDAAQLVAESRASDMLAEVAAARVQDLWWCAPDGPEVAAAADAWVLRHCPDRSGPRRPAGPDRLTFGFLVAGEVRADIQLAVAQIARALNRQTVQPLGYGIGSATHPRNVGYRNAFIQWRDIRQIDPATLARIFAGDGVDVIIDAAGYGYASGVLAVARSDVPLRLLWPQLPTGSAPAPYDARLVAGDTADDMPAGLLPFAVSDIPAPVRPRVQETADLAAGGCPRLVVGCDLLPVQANKEVLAVLAAIATVSPDIVVAIRDNGFSNAVMGERLLAGLGPEAAAAVQLVEASDPADFCRYLDLAVAPLLPASAAPLVHALSVGCPIVTLERNDGRDGGYAALMRACGLSDLVAADPAGLIRRAAGLLLEPQRLGQVRRKLRDFDLTAVASPARLADGLEQAIRRALAQVGGGASA